jgi:hypothetical protein
LLISDFQHGNDFAHSGVRPILFPIEGI